MVGFGLGDRIVIVEGPDRSQQVVRAVGEGEVGFAILKERDAIGFFRVEVSVASIG